MATRYWLLKSEPGDYSIDDLEEEVVTEWWGVRNYKARNYMRDDMRIGDKVLFYHSMTKPLGVYGLAEVATEAHPDSKQFETGHRYFDPKSDPDNSRWWCVDIRHLKTFDQPVTRDVLKETSGLEEMALLRRGMRLSVMPVTESEYEIVAGLGS